MTLTIAQIRQEERAELENRKELIFTLLKKYSKHRGWKKAFLDSNPMFNNSVGITMITNAHTGRVADVHLLKALESFDELVKTEQPNWFKITQ
jgi:hypothetical protein